MQPTRSRPRAIASLFVLSALSFRPVVVRGGPPEDRGGHAPGGSPSETGTPVRAVRVMAGELSPMRRAYGLVDLVPAELGAVVARTAGRILTVEVSEGAVVAEKAVLLRVDDRAAQDALVKAGRAVASARSELERAESFTLDQEQHGLEAEAAQARAAVEAAARESRRREALLKDGMTPEKTVVDARVALEIAERTAAAVDRKLAEFREHGRSSEVARLRAGIELAEADLAPARRAIEDAVVRAPRAGRVTGLEVRPGQWVEPGTRIATVVPEHGATVRVSVPLDVANALPPRARARIAGTSSWTGTVRLVAPTCEAESGFVRVWIDLDGEQATFRLAQAVVLELETGAPVRGTLVPIEALDGRENPPRVVVVENGVSKGRPVNVLMRDATSVVVAAAEVPVGTLVVIEGGYNLPDGTHVDVEVAK